MKKFVQKENLKAKPREPKAVKPRSKVRLPLANPDHRKLVAGVVQQQLRRLMVEPTAMKIIWEVRLEWASLW